MQGKNQGNTEAEVPAIDEIFEMNRNKVQRMCDEIIGQKGDSAGSAAEKQSGKEK